MASTLSASGFVGEIISKDGKEDRNDDEGRLLSNTDTGIKVQIKVQVQVQICIISAARGMGTAMATVTATASYHHASVL
jgi:hypothetical protein